MVAARACSIQMSLLTGATFGLAFDTLVAARASAGNAYGLGAVSPVNTGGARTRRAPDQMAPPALVSVSEASISISWVALGPPLDGNSGVLAYTVYWDNGSGSTTIALLDGLATSVAVPGLVGGVTYRFKVRARNVYGAGAFSSELSVLASDLPDKVATPTVSVGAAATSVTIAWSAPFDHAAPVDYYEVLLQAAGGAFVTACDGTDAAIIAALACSVPMVQVAALTGLAVDSLLRARVRAHNANGWGAASELNAAGATLESLPEQMAAPALVIATSDLTQIVLTWQAVTGAAAGGASVSVSGYVLEWDAGGSAWATYLTTASTGATSAGLTGGTLYSYRVAATNKLGTGPFSPALAVVAAQAPATPAAPVTSLETIYVEISWSAPADNFDTITAYQVLIADSAGNFAERTSVCDGSQQATLDGLRCLVPMTALWASPFSLAQGAPVTATVRARNGRGWSGTSTPNAPGAVVETLPHAPGAPARGVATTDTAIQVDWPALSGLAEGGSPVLGYALYSDAGSGQASWVELVGYTATHSATTYTQTGSGV